MNTKLYAVCGVVALLLVGTGGAVASGPGFAPGADRGANPGTGPSDTPASSAGNGVGAPGATSADAAPFDVDVDEMNECGRTCRDVTSALTNRQNATAENVTVDTRIYAGHGADGELVWRGSEAVGTLPAHESYTATTRIELSIGDALSVKQKGGWITVQTTVETVDQTVTFTEQRKVT